MPTQPNTTLYLRVMRRLGGEGDLDGDRNLACDPDTQVWGLDSTKLGDDHVSINWPLELLYNRNTMTYWKQRTIVTFRQGI